MRNAIVTILLLAASTAFAQFGGGSCPSGGFVDRYSGQSVSGEKTFCSTATFNSGLVLGLDPKDIIGLTAAALPPTGLLYWGNRQVCDSSGNCPGGGGGVSPWSIRPLTLSNPLGSTPGFILVADSTFSVVNSVIRQDDGLDMVVLDNLYSLAMVSTNTLSTNYKASGVSSNGIFNLEANGNLTLQAQGIVVVQSAFRVVAQAPTEVALESGNDISILANDKIFIDGSGGIDVSTNGNLTLAVNGNLVVGGQSGITGSLNGGQGGCPLGQNEYILFAKGIVYFQGCH